MPERSLEAGGLAGPLRGEAAGAEGAGYPTDLGVEADCGWASCYPPEGLSGGAADFAVKISEEMQIHIINP